MLLLDDDEELSETPSQAEACLTAELGPDAIKQVDDSLCRHATRKWLKSASVVVDSLRDRGFPTSDTHVALLVRRVIALVQSGALEAQGNLRKPRWSEVRLPEEGSSVTRRQGPAT
jgi:hypothetical protein